MPHHSHQASEEPKLSFMSANFLGREKGYLNVTGFGEGSTSVAEAFAPAATYGERIDRLFEEVAAMGYKGIDLWTAHCNPNWAGKQHVKGVLAAAQKHGVEIVSIAGGMGPDLAKFEDLCRLACDIGCPLLGMGGSFIEGHAAEVESILSRYNLHLGFENHPEETPEILLERIGHGCHPHIGTTLDTGWWGTHGVPLDEALAKLKEQIRLVHFKNIAAPGGHIAARWDQGCLDLKSFLSQLRRSGYSGWISMEYEPLDHDPSEDCRLFRQQVEEWWKE
jgi:L-ribulose-5-phosphate 3-epimerase